MNKTERKFHTSKLLFHTTTKRLWHREFNSTRQEKILAACDASVTTYIVEHELPFTDEPAIVEYPVLELQVPAEARDKEISFAFDIVKEFLPDYYEVSRGVVVLGWRKGFPPKGSSVSVSDLSAKTEPSCMVVRDDAVACASLREGYGNGPIYLYSVSSSWLFSDQELSSQYLEALQKKLQL